MRYKPGDQIQAVVQRIFHFGIFVQIDEKFNAYIRKRELSLSGDADPRILFSVGETITTRVINLPADDRMMELSLKQALPDPWDSFVQSYKVGDVVTATVRNMYSNGVYVEIIPGVNGFIPTENLASWTVERPDEFLVRSDRVEVVILNIDKTNKHIHLSIQHRLQQLVQAQALYEKLPTETNIDESSEFEETSEEDTMMVGEINERIDLKDAILVVEDHDDLRESLLKFLEDHGCTSHGVSNGRIAQETFSAKPYGLVIVDLDLPEINGMTFIQSLRDGGHKVPVAVMSTPEEIALNERDLARLGVAVVFVKPLDTHDILTFLATLSSGVIPQIVLALGDTGPLEPPVDQGRLASTLRPPSNLNQGFENRLAELVIETGSEMGFIFQMAPVSEQITIASQVGDLSLNDDALYGLAESPVRDVMKEGIWLLEHQVTQRDSRRFEKLLDLLVFDSCIAVPIRSRGNVQYAIFLFHRDPQFFSRYRLRDTRAAAMELAAYVENDRLLNQIRSLSGIFLSGQLAAAFGHEIFNKLSALDLQFTNLNTRIDELLKVHQDEIVLKEFEHVRDSVYKAGNTAAELKQTVKGFRRLMQSSQANDVDVGLVLKQAVNQIRPVAKKARVQIRLNPLENLPQIIGNHVGLLQVMLNLMLNAIQHMEDPEWVMRVLLVSTDIKIDAGQTMVVIRCKDTGPGIHYQNWDRIFDLGYTTRIGGSGLGLYIARSLIESMDGCIVVSDSLIPFGTTFEIKLQAVNQDRRGPA